MRDVTLHLDVELVLGDGTIRGTVDDGRGPALRFTGWLELMSAFDTLQARASSGGRDSGDVPEAPG